MKIRIFRPGKMFPPVSVTGARCELMCDHCRGVHLTGMYHAENEDTLTEKARSICASGGTGMLISGGCGADGKVPVTRFAGAIGRISGMGLKINVHAGFLTEDEASELVIAGVSRFSADVHQDPDVIKNILHLDAGPEEYERTIRNIIAAGGIPVPHVTAGFGLNDIVLSAEMLRRHGINEIVLLALIRTRGTGMAEASKECVLEAIDALTGTGFDVTLGCMRPRDPETETEAVERGVRKIANMSVRTAERLKERGFSVTEENTCCCMTAF